jgi:dTDP-4-amino-4,6-dideoxygalactose transaminase
MMYATQYRESYPYYQHEKIGFNYRMSNICAGIGRGQMTVANDHIAHHKHVQKLYEELLAGVPGITVHSQPNHPSSLPSLQGGAGGRLFDSNYWLCTITIDEDVKIKGQENAYKTIITSAVGGAAGVIHVADSATTDCQPNDNVEALRVGLDALNIEARPVWKPMHRQPVYRHGAMEEVRCKMEGKDGETYTVATSESSVAYINGVSEEIFKKGMCLPAGPYVSDDDVKYIVEAIKSLIF